MVSGRGREGEYLLTALAMFTRPMREFRSGPGMTMLNSCSITGNDFKLSMSICPSELSSNNCPTLFKPDQMIDLATGFL